MTTKSTFNSYANFETFVAAHHLEGLDTKEFEKSVWSPLENSEDANQELSHYIAKRLQAGVETTFAIDAMSVFASRVNTAELIDRLIERGRL